MNIRGAKIFAIVVGAAGWVVIIFLLIVATGLAFLTADNRTLYSAADTFSWLLIAIPIAFYFIAGFVFGRSHPELSWQWGLWITLGFCVVVMFLLALQPRYANLIFIILIPFVLSSLGGYSGAKLSIFRSK
jgi:hypothetical protein